MKLKHGYRKPGPRPGPDGPKIKRAFTLSPEASATIDRSAEEEERSASEIVDRAVRLYGASSDEPPPLRSTPPPRGL